MILDEIVADKKKRLVEHKARCGEKEMQALAEKKMELWEKGSLLLPKESFYQALKKPGLSIIGEFKKASPSMGIIKSQIDLTERIEQYNASVDAISCLTEEDHFHGNVEYLKKIRSMSPLPIIRKDFIIDPYQIYEAREIGADAVLLIAAILEDEELKTFSKLAGRYGLDVLLEVHDEREMGRAVEAGAAVIGVNNRNLKDFTIDLHTTGRLVQFLDSHIGKKERPVFVSESGVTKEEDILFLKEYGVDALLIGRAFMETREPEETAKGWKSIYNQTAEGRAW